MCLRPGECSLASFTRPRAQDGVIQISGNVSNATAASIDPACTSLASTARVATAAEHSSCATTDGSGIVLTAAAVNSDNSTLSCFYGADDSRGCHYSIVSHFYHFSDRGTNTASVKSVTGPL
jgi:hypothetical protein